MCYNGKCLHCIPVEHGSLAFGILSMIGTGMMLLWSIVQGIIIAVDLSHPHTANVEGDHEGFQTFLKAFLEVVPGNALIVTTVIVVAIVAVASLIAFILSVLLFVGVRNRRPEKVLFYFICGSVIMVLSASASVLSLYSNNNNNSLPGIIGLSLCAIYSLCLVMIYKTYTKLSVQQEAMFKNNNTLVEAYKLDP